MRVLFVTCHLPFPPVSGGRKRELELLKRMDGVEVDLVAVSKTPEADLANRRQLEKICRSVMVLPAVPTGAPAGLPPQVTRHWCPDAAAVIEGSVGCGAVDLVHVEGFYLMHLLPENCPVPVLLVEQNIEFELFAQQLALIPGRAERTRALSHYRATREAEISAWRRADVVGALTDRDRAAVRRELPDARIALIPDGIGVGGTETADSLFVDEPGDARIVFVGNFAYTPNVDAARWLHNDVFRLVRREVPEAQLYLVGNEPPEEVSAWSRTGEVVVTGTVSDVEPYLASAQVVVCPLRIGGGVKVKMLEALAAGKAIVTTPVGAQGLGGARGAFVEAASAPEFAEAIVRILRNPDHRRSLERAARRLAARMPTWDEASAALRAQWSALARTDVSVPQSA